jgi:phosphoglycolate phosphatase
MIALSPIIVFDLDGTLADTAPDLIGTLNFLLAREGHAPVPPAAARAMVGAGARALIEKGFAERAGAPPAGARLEALVAEFLVRYEARIALETRLFPGAVAALELFLREGFALAVCTNKPERLAKLLLQELGVAPLFAAICGRDTHPVHKPDGRALLLTVAAAGGDPARALMVGDSRTDVDAARNAGRPVIAVDFGYTETPARDLGADRVISHYDELWPAALALATAC